MGDKGPLPPPGHATFWPQLPSTCDKNPAPGGSSGLEPRDYPPSGHIPYISLVTLTIATKIAFFGVLRAHLSGQAARFRPFCGYSAPPGGAWRQPAANQGAQAAEHRRPGVRSAHSADDGPSNAHQKASGGDQGEQKCGAGDQSGARNHVAASAQA
jgi:hypothetical protein